MKTRATQGIMMETTNIIDGMIAKLEQLDRQMKVLQEIVFELKRLEIERQKDQRS